MQLKQITTMNRLISYVCLLILMTSCASILGGSKAKITVDNAEPISSPVVMSVDGVQYTDIYLPAKVRVKGGFKPSTITATAQGYSEGKAIVDKKFNSTTLWNIVLGGIPGMAIDAATGAMMKPSQKHYTMNMHPSNYVERLDVQQTTPKEQVSRDNPGNTSMEKTIIRWYFESAPQGARIFWRVISSVPEQVKNTNENWLGNTPFEETRSFNILGLTYENANDVQIEIKVRRPGYIDQTKRFNVRQAIDQQEISAFFDMVKAEE